MISFEQCADFAGLAANELASCATPSSMSRSLYASYLLHIGKGAPVVREMIVLDMRWSRELGATKQAADLAVVLRAFLSDHPEGRLIRASNANDIRLFEAHHAVSS